MSGGNAVNIWKLPGGAGRTRRRQHGWRFSRLRLGIDGMGQGPVLLPASREGLSPHGRDYRPGARERIKPGGAAVTPDHDILDDRQPWPPISPHVDMCACRYVGVSRRHIGPYCFLPQIRPLSGR